MFCFNAIQITMLVVGCLALIGQQVFADRQIFPDYQVCAKSDTLNDCTSCCEEQEGGRLFYFDHARSLKLEHVCVCGLPIGDRSIELCPGEISNEKCEQCCSEDGLVRSHLSGDGANCLCKAAN